MLTSAGVYAPERQQRKSELSSMNIAMREFSRRSRLVRSIGSYAEMRKAFQ